ncbi:MAG: TonB-dependent receptor [Bryobacteraceae bacterium]
MRIPFAVRGPRVLALGLLLASGVFAQSAGSGGTIDGTVVDPTGAVVPGAVATLNNMVTGYTQGVRTDATGMFHFRNVPQNQYHLQVSASGFQQAEQDVPVRTTVPIALKITLQLAGSTTSVTVEAENADLLETVPSAHTDVDRSVFSSLPITSASNGLSDAITLSSPGVAADSNGLFHPLGDHAQSSLYLDGQPITDQQSKQFSTQIPLNAIQSMELITSTPDAQYGDKTSLVANAVTRSGLGAARPFGSFEANYGSFGSYGEDFAIGGGRPKFGYFLAANASRSGRFLDSPEFRPLHDIGNSQTIFNRLDYQPGGRDAMHLNLFLARNWFQTPNTYDQQAAGQDQRQMSRTVSIAPGYVRTFHSSMVLTWNPYARTDFINYDPSRNPFADQPVTIFSRRSLKNYGSRADVSIVRNHHNIKTGVQISRTHLNETFAFGVTDPQFVDPEAQPGLVPYDLTRGGSRLNFHANANVDQFAWYAQDSLTFGNFTLTGGLRFDWYSGIARDTSVQPRVGGAYHITATGTVLRAGYSHTFETPYNENLILASSTGAGGLAVNALGAFAATPLRPGRRNQYNAGFEQAFLKKFLISSDYFWKYTTNAYDFAALLNSPIVFPISWRKSKIDGVSARVTLTNYHGLTAYTAFGHSRARYFGPSNGGLIFDEPLETESVFRIDHDQAFQQTTFVRYQAPFQTQPWAAFTWRYDSGMVAGAVETLDDALGLTAAQQAAIGFFCGNQFASLGHPITSCASGNYGAALIDIPAEGTANSDHNPPRIAPRNLFDLGVGANNLFRGERYKVKLSVTATNLTGKVALYNFLSTFNGTHFISPRAVKVEIGLEF